MSRSNYESIQPGELGIAEGGDAAELPAKSSSPWSDAAVGHMKSRPGGSARRAHVGRELSWSTKPGGLDIPSAMPKGASLSPCGDVGALGQTEAVTVFPDLRKMGSRTVQASKQIPLKEKWIK
jgi:hypothetical protein